MTAPSAWALLLLLVKLLCHLTVLPGSPQAVSPILCHLAVPPIHHQDLRLQAVLGPQAVALAVHLLAR
jgi:hypothetical protein